MNFSLAGLDGKTILSAVAVICGVVLLIKGMGTKAGGAGNSGNNNKSSNSNSNNSNNSGSNTQ